MDLYPSMLNTRTYNRMRDRLIDLSRQYTRDEIVRLERLGYRHVDTAQPVALRTSRWALGEVLTDDELDRHIRRVLRQLDVGPSTDAPGEFVIGASWDGCADDDDRRDSRHFDDVDDLIEFYEEMERQGRNPSHTNSYGPRGWEVGYDRDEEE